MPAAPFASYPSLRDRVVLITGGASGIGEDLVRGFAAQGARVAFLDIQHTVGEALADALAGGAHKPLFVPCDVTDIASLRGAIAHVAQTAGPVAVLVNNAANDQRQAVADVTPEDWDTSQAVNLRHHFFAAQAVHPQMKSLGRGSIVNFSSIAWRHGAADMAAYATAKAAVQGLTKSLARAYGPDNIRVNAVEPGAVLTPRQRALWYRDEQSVAAIVRRQALGRTLLGDEVARLVLFLGADDSRMITKQSFVVDAGLS